jgi:hypothetical protein
MRVVLILLSPLAACVTALTPAGRAVRLTANPDAVRGCKLLGEVRGADHVLPGDAAEQNADARLRNAAAALGANVVFLTTSDIDRDGATFRGEAYACPLAGA